MRPHILGSLLLLILTGCQSPKDVKNTAGESLSGRKSGSPARAQSPAGKEATATGSGGRTALVEGEAGEAAVSLPKFEVFEKGFTDFGISIVTNPGVMHGEAITWMRVGTVRLGSSAAEFGLVTGDEILAIDGRLLAKVSREEMLRAFFQRESGDELKLLVMGQRILLPRFVVLKAHPTPKDK